MVTDLDGDDGLEDLAGGRRRLYDSLQELIAFLNGRGVKNRANQYYTTERI